MKQIEPSKLEMQLLSVLWERGPSTVREVLETLSDGKTRAYTTVLTVMQVMEKKGLVSHRPQGNAHVYEARVSRRKVAGPLWRTLVQQVFGGNTASAMQNLLEEGSVSTAELAEIKKLIAAHEQTQGSPGAQARQEPRPAGARKELR